MFNAHARRPEFSRYGVMIALASLTMMSITTTAFAEETSPPNEAAKVSKANKIEAQRRKQKTLSFQKDNTSALKRIKSLQDAWTKSANNTTTPTLKHDLNIILFSSMNLEMSLKSMKQAYTVNRQRKGVRACDRLIKANKTFADHLRALKAKKTLTIDDLKQKTYDGHLQTVLAGVQTLPTFTPK